MNLLVKYARPIILSVLLASITLYVLAQDKKVDVDTNVGKKEDAQWYMSPVAWVIGGAVFILILVALLRGRSKD